MTPAPRASTAPSSRDLLEQADRLEGEGLFLEAVDLLHAANQELSRGEFERRLAVLRHRAFDQIDDVSPFPSWPVPVPEVDDAEVPCVPRIAPADLDAEAVRRAIATHGSAHVPGLVGPARVAELVEGIEHVLALREANRDTPYRRRGPWLAPLPLPRDQAAALARDWIAGDGGILACDSPRLLEQVFTAYEEVGLREVVGDYLGERPALSANKATLRRARLEGHTDWHQDGAFLGSGIRALNVWVALTDCGVDAPGLDLVPRRFADVQTTGTGGAIFDWAVGPDVVSRLSVDAPVVRPRYRAGDVMLFDELFLHRTALDASMTRPRHAVESWFFAPSSYPDGHVPLVW